jgi:putative colanic acid biosynthesis acetyltransferase WcaB
MLTSLKEDIVCNKGNTKGLFFIVVFRLCSFRFKNKSLNILLFPISILYKIIIQWILGIDISLETKIGKGFKLYHGIATVIHPNVIIGDYVIIRQSTTIGAKDNNGLEVPRICDCVDIGSNCVIIGGITIHENSKIGAGSVIVKNIESGSVAIGTPTFRIIR